MSVSITEKGREGVGENVTEGREGDYVRGERIVEEEHTHKEPSEVI